MEDAKNKNPLPLYVYTYIKIDRISAHVMAKGIFILPSKVSCLEKIRYVCEKPSKGKNTFLEKIVF